MKKFISLFLSIITIITSLSISFSAFASSIGSSTSDIDVATGTVTEEATGKDDNGNSTSYNTVNVTEDETSSSVNIYASKDSSSEALLPKTVILDGSSGSSNSGKYVLAVKGDIAGNENIVITPSSTVKLTSKGNPKTITATITQNKNTFSYADGVNPDTYLTTTGTITTNEPLSAGKWSGQYNYNVIREIDLLPGYTTLYEYDLSASDADDVKAYYMVPNENTEPVEVKNESESQIYASTSSVKSLFTPITAYAAENEDNIIEYNGIRYTLSDEDELVISGEGEMKENIQADLIQYAKIQEAVCSKFNAKIMDYNYDEMEENVPYLQYTKNSLYPYKLDMIVDGHYSTSYNDDSLYELITEIREYIDTIYSDYIVSMPTSVIIHEGVTNISNEAFYNCASLNNVEIPSSVTSIGYLAFSGCTNLDNVVLPENINTIGYRAFASCKSLSSISIPYGVKNIDTATFELCTNLTNVIIPETVTEIGNYAFNNCSKLSNIIIPKSVTKIGAFAFKKCSSLTSIEFPQGVEEIGSSLGGVFENCSNLESIIIPDSVIKVGNLGTNRTTTYYCQSQRVADLVKSNLSSSYPSSLWYTVVVDDSLFS